MYAWRSRCALIVVESSVAGYYLITPYLRVREVLRTYMET